MSEAVKTALYRHWDGGGRLLYVGIAGNPLQRAGSHRERSAWFESIRRMDIEWYDSREAALDAEKQAIKTEAPLFNQVHVDPFAVVRRPLTWAVLHVEAGLVDGWYRDETDAQEVMDFLRETFADQHFLLVKEQSADRRMLTPQFTLTVDEADKWVLEFRGVRFSAD